ncbi:MAG: FAD-dependent oxidoreductase [Ilumatobacteraceae bacterium]
MEYLPLANKVQQGDMDRSPIDVAGKHVVIIGGGDTGADCLGTAHRQGAASVTQLEIMPRPSDTRAPGNPWPTFAFTYKVTSAHEEGGERLYSVNTERFVDDGNGNVRALLIHEVQMVNGKFEKVEGSDRELPADFVFLAMGFVGPDKGSWLDQLGVALDARGNIARGDDFQTNVPGVFVAGDMGRGQSLIVWAIAEWSRLRLARRSVADRRHRRCRRRSCRRRVRSPERARRATTSAPSGPSLAGRESDDDRGHEPRGVGHDGGVRRPAAPTLRPPPPRACRSAPRTTSPSRPPEHGGAGHHRPGRPAPSCSSRAST